MSRKVETKLLYGYRITTKKDEDSTIRQFNGHAERELVVPFFPPFISSYFYFFLGNFGSLCVAKRARPIGSSIGATVYSAVMRMYIQYRLAEAFIFLCRIGRC